MTNKALLVGGIRACRQLLGHTHALTIASDNPESFAILGAYKDIDAVMENQKDLTETLHTMKQVVCVKG